MRISPTVHSRLLFALTSISAVQGVAVTAGPFDGRTVNCAQVTGALAALIKVRPISNCFLQRVPQDPQDDNAGGNFNSDCWRHRPPLRPSNPLLVLLVRLWVHGDVIDRLALSIRRNLKEQPSYKGESTCQASQRSPAPRYLEVVDA
ncbi:hypothetical protein T440DRAFT_512490 [Plenodomus tracheiphilus IPT5]|uniref:Uncharacterized protein n=1 Tax=Plenodomus tracheiphilus IPT5 TaxID=1408161 RepID=A0A6A7BPD1_9PLEO|nr:hypothetical protein T440DRAFT_512490 [Plenodomus tracheiphilus IPT5]